MTRVSGCVFGVQKWNIYLTAGGGRHRARLEVFWYTMVKAIEQTATKTQADTVAIDITDEFDLLHAYKQTSSSAQRKAEIYQPGRYRCFAVKEPKIREIFAPSFRDRLVHHLLVDRLMPLIDRRLIFDSFANRPAKGAHLAVRRLQRFMRQLPPTAYYMQCDIESYFTITLRYYR